MKRTIALAAVAAVLVGGGIATTAAFAHVDNDDRGPDRAPLSADQHTGSTRSTGDRVTLDEAVAAALKAVPGTVTEVELDDDDHGARLVWELDVYGTDAVWHDVTVDASSGKVLSTRDDDHDDRDRHAPRQAAVSWEPAVAAALKAEPGTVTSVELDDDDHGHLYWEIDVTGGDGRDHELRVDARTAAVSVDRDDD
ncbi:MULTISPECIES: PepSY domain-containing protein [unclassified Streptomyces]|uniref:PepSY domain-containing protein n=1 Tax=unclassified Streptomyces TaxID=2593676 RepID=UPI000CD4DACB|nr:MULTISPECIES: PepSY domain-containing protein [unclassified Streptomyces]AWL40630.1 peptidase M4 [Streptomyces sp. SM18]